MVLLIVGLSKDARAECAAGYVELFDQNGEAECVSEGYLRMQRQIQGQTNRGFEKRRQEGEGRQRANQTQTEEQTRQWKYYLDTLTHEQRRRILQQRPP